MTVRRCPYCSELVKQGQDQFPLILTQPNGFEVRLYWHSECAEKDAAHLRLADAVCDVPGSDVIGAYSAVRDRASEWPGELHRVAVRKLTETIHVTRQPHDRNLTGRTKSLSGWGIERIRGCLKK